MLSCMPHSCDAVRGFIRRINICSLLVLALASSTFAQTADTATFPIVFPAATQTVVRPFNCFDFLRAVVVPGPNGADTVFSPGDFINVNGNSVFAIDDSNGFCANTLNIVFQATVGRPATSLPSAVVAEIVNLSGLDDVIECVVIDDDNVQRLVGTQLVPAGGRATFAVQGRHIYIVGFGSAIHATNYTFPSVFGVASLTITQPAPSPIQAVASFETPGTAPARFTKATTSAPVTLQVPLGTVFTVGLQKATALIPTPLNSIFGVGVSTVQPAVRLMPTATVVPVVQTLFAGHALVQVDDDNLSATKRFIAVHLGTAPITITPFTSPNDPQRQINVEVILPTDLGTTENSFADGNNDLDLDDYVSNAAHNTGIPPQYLKGQVHQEEYIGEVRADNWRYEPCGADLRYVSAGVRKAYTNSQFIPFRLDDAIGVRLHPGIRDELDPRNVFFVRRPDPITGTIVDRRINDNDTNVTVREIWDDNNNVAGNGHIRMNFSTGCRRSVRQAIDAPNSTTLNFVAQTPTATSAGLMQVMWEEAIQARFWSGVSTAVNAGLKEPKYVFDRLEYVNIGGGSLQIGANKDVVDWRGGSDAKFTTLAAYEVALHDMMRAYNPWWTDNGDDYGDRVVSYSRDAAPALPTTAFP